MLWIFLGLLLCYGRGTNTVTAQADCKVSTYGTEFVFGFFDVPYTTISGNMSSPDISIFVTTKGGTDIHITLQSKTSSSASKTPTEITTTEYVYHSREISFNSSFINRYHSKSSGGVIKITSDDPISLMAMYRFAGYERSDHIKVHPIFPTKALSKSYVIPSYEGNAKYHSKNQFSLVGINDSTSVRFEGYETGSMVYTVDRNDIFIYEREVDFSSTTAESNHPVVIFSYITSGHVSNPSSNTYDRSLTMQVPPLDPDAVHFVVPSLTGNSVDKYRVRIYASSQNAVVQIHSTSDQTQTVHVYHKIFYELFADASDILEIVSDSPIVVVQIALNSYRYALFMTEIPAVSQYLSSYYVGFPSGKSTSPSTQLVITIPSTEVSGLLIDRKPVIHDSSKLTQSPLGNFTIVTRTGMSRASITHAGGKPFAVLAMGQWNANSRIGGMVYEAYGFQGGMQFTKPGCGSVSNSGQVVG